jgi:acetyl esterase/lipase
VFLYEGDGTMRALRLVVALAALGLCSGRAVAGAPGVKSGGDFEVEAVKDIDYHGGKDADKVRHRLDLFLPKGQKDYPVLVFVHGGAWSKGNKNGFEKFARLFARNGIGTAITNYRLSPQVQHPAHAQDVAKAVAWVHKNIAKHGGRPDQLFLSGHSAGGHLVALLGTDSTYLEAAGVPTKDIKGVIPISGVYTFRPGSMPKVLGEDKEAYKKAAPLTHVKGQHPPFLILVADNDLKGFDRMAEQFCQALEKGRCTATVINVKDRDHGSIVRQMTNQADPTTQAVLTFIARYSNLKLLEGKAAKSAID